VLLLLLRDFSFLTIASIRCLCKKARRVRVQAGHLLRQIFNALDLPSATPDAGVGGNEYIARIIFPARPMQSAKPVALSAIA
jgi:hypothetical protein